MYRQKSFFLINEYAAETFLPWTASYITTCYIMERCVCVCVCVCMNKPATLHYNMLHHRRKHFL